MGAALAVYVDFGSVRILCRYLWIEISYTEANATGAISN
jgi:hypothetical protein